MGLLVLFENTIQTSTSAERNLLIYMVAVLLTFSSLIIIFFIVFQKRKNKLLLDKIKQQQLFDEEISKTQTEIQEQTLKHIGWELHDNVGQLLAFANMQLNMLSSQVEDKLKDKVEETTKTIAESLKEVRLLSKSLNNEVLLNNGFVSSIESELQRLKRMKFNSANLEVKGDIKPFTNKKHEIIIFRILQEFFSNSVKYSEAEHLKVELHYDVNTLRIIASDDGIGFDFETAEKGSGLINMKSRAQLINADFNLNSKPNQGVTLELSYQL